jgi:hypothetical protein
MSKKPLKYYVSSNWHIATFEKPFAVIYYDDKGKEVVVSLHKWRDDADREAYRLNGEYFKNGLPF